MKTKTLLLLTAFGGSLLVHESTQAAFDHLDVTVTEYTLQEGHGNHSPGTVLQIVRVYAHFNDPADRLNVVYGNSAFPMVIATADGSPLYQQDTGFGGVDAGSEVDTSLFGTPGSLDLVADSWLTIGADSIADGAVPLGFAPFFPPSGWTRICADNHSWQRLPGDPFTSPDARGNVLIGQFSVEAGAFVYGLMNLTTVEDGVSGTHFGVLLGHPPILCSGDTNDDRMVDVNDLINVILDWGTDGSANGGDVAGPAPCLSPDGIVDVTDLNAVIVGWGSSCP